ncbi:hypothetical protein MBANPS3_000811 [Mucor bainieri]
MALRLLTSRVIARASVTIPVVHKSAAMAAFRGYATKKYGREHEWISIDDDVATIGITDFAQKELGEIVVAECPEVGSKTHKGDSFAFVESVKAVCTVNSPVKGKVLETNEDLLDDYSLINSSPEENGWLAKVKISNEDEYELDGFMDKGAYQAYCESCEHD